MDEVAVLIVTIVYQNLLVLVQGSEPGNRLGRSSLPLHKLGVSDDPNAATSFSYTIDYQHL